MAEKMKPDKLMLDVRQADAAGLSYGRWRFEETERIIRKTKKYEPRAQVLEVSYETSRSQQGNIRPKVVINIV